MKTYANLSLLGKMPTKIKNFYDLYNNYYNYYYTHTYTNTHV